MTDWIPVDLDEPIPTGFIEPWHPEPGQRVRVRLSGECAALFQTSDLTGKRAEVRGHDPEVNGAVGFVRPPEYLRALGFRRDVIAAAVPGHPYFVVYLAPIRTARYGAPLIGGRFAACELEPEAEPPSALWIDGQRVEGAVATRAKLEPLFNTAEHYRIAIEQGLLIGLPRLSWLLA